MKNIVALSLTALALSSVANASDLHAPMLARISHLLPAKSNKTPEIREAAFLGKDQTGATCQGKVTIMDYNGKPNTVMIELGSNGRTISYGFDMMTMLDFQAMKNSATGVTIVHSDVNAQSVIFQEQTLEIVGRPRSIPSVVRLNTKFIDRDDVAKFGSPDIRCTITQYL